MRPLSLDYELCSVQHPGWAWQGVAVLGADRGGFLLLVPFTEAGACFCDLLTGMPLSGNWVSQYLRPGRRGCVTLRSERKGRKGGGIQRSRKANEGLRLRNTWKV